MVLSIQALQPLDLIAAILQKQIKYSRQTASTSDAQAADCNIAALEAALAECQNNRALVLLCLPEAGEGGVDVSGNGEGKGVPERATKHVSLGSAAAIKALDECLQLCPEHATANYNYTLLLWEQVSVPRVAGEGLGRRGKEGQKRGFF